MNFYRKDICIFLNKKKSTAKFVYYRRMPTYLQTVKQAHSYTFNGHFTAELGTQNKPFLRRGDQVPEFFDAKKLHSLFCSKFRSHRALSLFKINILFCCYCDFWCFPIKDLAKAENAYCNFSYFPSSFVSFPRMPKFPSKSSYFHLKMFQILWIACGEIPSKCFNILGRMKGRE